MPKTNSYKPYCSKYTHTNTPVCTFTHMHLHKPETRNQVKGTVSEDKLKSIRGLNKSISSDNGKVRGKLEEMVSGA